LESKHLLDASKIIQVMLAQDKCPMDAKNHAPLDTLHQSVQWIMIFSASIGQFSAQVPNCSWWLMVKKKLQKYG
jgi:hypothetical protein